MELIVNEIRIPERISFNYDELKQELVATLQRYEGLVYTPDQMKAAKADKASLNKLKKALNDERIRLEREYMKPFAEFKAQIADLISAIDKPVALIDRQVKEYEEQKKCEKRQTIEELFDSIRFDTTFDWLQLDQIFKPQWLNATASMKSIEEEIQRIIDSIVRDISVLSEMPAFAFEATEVYKQTLNLQMAVNEGKRLADIQKRKAEAEAMRAAQQAQAADLQKQFPDDYLEEEQPEVAAWEKPQGQWIAFKAHLTVAQAVDLKMFFNRNGIEYKAI